jgi:hypothetical protein
MNISDILVGFCSRECIEQFHEARFVRITHRGLAIWLDPFGMLDPQVVVYLLPKLGVGVDLVSHCHWLGERFKYALERFLQSLGGIVDQRWHRGRAPTANLGYPERPYAPAHGCARRWANSTALQCWRCNNTASSPLCVRVAAEVIT